MAKYTVTIHELIEAGWNFDLNEYPIFNSAYRTRLNAKILGHYRFREIGFETPQLFTHYLNLRMNEIMPFYNQLYETLEYDFDPLTNYRLKEIIDNDETILFGTDTYNSTDSAGTASSNGDNKQIIDTRNDVDMRHEQTGNVTHEKDTDVNTSWHESGGEDKGHSLNYQNRKSDTPQGMLTKGFMSDDTWISEANEHKESGTNGGTYGKDGSNLTQTNGRDADVYDTTNTDNGFTTNTGTVDNDYNDKSDTVADATSRSDTDSKTDTFGQKIRDASGYMGITPMELIAKMRDNILNVDMMVIDALADLFMGIY